MNDETPHKDITMNGGIRVPADTNIDEVIDAFVELAEAHGWLLTMVWSEDEDDQSS